LTIACIASIAQGQSAKLQPVDEATKDPSFFAFRARLLKALARKDANYLISILDPQIKTDFGGGGGVADFKKAWHPERPNSQVWSELVSVLALGGSFDNGSFSAPYVYSKFPDEFDAYEYQAVIEDGVRVRREPNTTSGVIRTLSFEIVKVVVEPPKENSAAKGQWLAVELGDGQKGFIAKEYLRSPIDYRAIFEKKNGKWLMTAFVAGD
jgi:hypothetical protein